MFLLLRDGSRFTVQATNADCSHIFYDAFGLLGTFLFVCTLGHYVLNHCSWWRLRLHGFVPLKKNSFMPCRIRTDFCQLKAGCDSYSPKTTISQNNTNSIKFNYIIYSSSKHHVNEITTSVPSIVKQLYYVLQYSVAESNRLQLDVNQVC